MIVAGLTGSIGMGKSTVAHYLRARGIEVLDADQVVHDLYKGEAVPLIEAAFPDAVRDAIVDRAALSQSVLSSDRDLKKLESIIHPLVRDAEWRFLQAQRRKGAEIAVLEIPLLFETGAHDLFDAIIVASAPPEIQRERVLPRPGMSPEKLRAMLDRQWPDAVKRERADFVVDTGASLQDTFAQIDAILPKLTKRPAIAYGRWAELYQGKMHGGAHADVARAGSRHGNNRTGPEG
jgi:dephospho-CoA kinase